MDHTDLRNGVEPQSTNAPNWTIHVSDENQEFGNRRLTFYDQSNCQAKEIQEFGNRRLTFYDQSNCQAMYKYGAEMFLQNCGCIHLYRKIRTVKVSNISLAASERDIKEFFSFSGDIHYVEMQRESESAQLAYVTFKDSQGADTAMLLSGARIADLTVSITPVENYQLPLGVPPLDMEKNPASTGSAVKRAEDVVSSMLAKGFGLGKDALNKAKAFDERLHLTSNASATVASIDRKIGLSEKLSIGTAVVNVKVREMDERFQVSEKTKSAFVAAEQKASSTGSAIMSNHYMSVGASWVSSAFSAVAKAAEDVSVMTKDKLERAEEEKKEVVYRERTGIVNDYANIHLDESSASEPPVVPINSDDGGKLGII